MLLKYKADRRTVTYMAVTTLLLILQWNLGKVQPLIYVCSLFMAVSVSVVAHNHNHVPIWKPRLLNVLTNYWLTLFYGFPTFAWIPTHNRNHHRLNNKKGDYTITYRVSEKNNIFTLLSYPAISGYFQQKPVMDYLRNLWRADRPGFYVCISQYFLLGAYYALSLFLDWKKAILFILIPHQVALFSVLIFNYVQHVHADEESRYNHARNFVGLINPLLFNNGYHTIHHEFPGLHWSRTPGAQKQIEHLIDPSLNERSFWWYVVRVYLIAPFCPRFGTVSKRLERMRRTTPQMGM